MSLSPMLAWDILEGEKVEAVKQKKAADDMGIAKNIDTT